jgi:hypothetical protein
MGFLIRIALFLGLIILFIPADEAETKKLGSDQSVSLFDTFGFATTAYSDALGFCDRNRQACATGGVFVALFEAKARTGAHWVLGYLEPTAARQTLAPTGGPLAQGASMGQPPASLIATGSLRTQKSSEIEPAAAIGTVSIQPRAHGGFLPLPPARRPS